jgi:hypothetical protein
MTEPVGSQYGLDPLLDHTLVRPPVTSVDRLANDNSYKDGSEFGGVAGYAQPTPHVPTASERLSAIYAIDPTDPGTEAGSVAPPELEGAFNSEY